MWHKKYGKDCTEWLNLMLIDNIQKCIMYILYKMCNLNKKIDLKKN